MVHSSHPPPARAGTTARTHMNANTQLVHTDHDELTPKGPALPDKRFMLTWRAPAQSGDL